MELASEFKNVLLISNLSEEEQVMLDRMVVNIGELNNLLDYDSDYELTRYLQDIAVEVGDDNQKKLYFSIKNYVLDVLARLGISIDRDIDIGSLDTILESIHTLIELENDFLVDIDTFIKDNEFVEPTDLFIEILNNYTGFEETGLANYINSANLRIFSKIETLLPLEHPDDDFNLKIIEVLEALNANLLKAPILKEIIGLGKERLTNFGAYSKILHSNKYTIDTLIYSLTIIFLHIDKSVVLDYSKKEAIYDALDEMDVGNIIKNINECNPESKISKEDLYTKFHSDVMKYRGVKL